MTQEMFAMKINYQILKKIMKLHSTSLLYDLCLFLLHYYFLRLKETETVFLVSFFNSILVKQLESIF